MVTNQIMVRSMGDFKVEQRTKDGYFNGGDLLHQWNSVEGNPKRDMSKFIDGAKTKEFMDALKEDLAQSQKCEMAKIEILKEIKGKNTKNGRTPDQEWMHPFLFIKFAMWINPRFEVQVIKFVYDQMIKYRKEAGDAYIELSSAVATIVEPTFIPVAMSKIGEALNWIVFNEHRKMIRNEKGDEGKMRELFELERRTAENINDGLIKNYTELLSFLRKRYVAKRYPKVFLEK